MTFVLTIPPTHVPATWARALGGALTGRPPSAAIAAASLRGTSQLDSLRTVAVIPPASLMTGSWFTRWFSSEPAAGSTAAAASAASDTQDAPKGCFSHSYKDAHAHQYSQTVAVDACAGSTAAAADAALRTSAAQTAAHATRLRQHAPRLAHEVLNNGQAIKHTARHAGHAVAADGTRLYVDVYEVGASDGSRNAAALGDTAAGPAQADCASAAVDEDGVANVLCIMGKSREQGATAC